MAETAQDSLTQSCGTNDASSFPDPLKSLIWNAVLEKATDVHLHSVAQGLRVLHRVDGLIHPRAFPPRAGVCSINSRAPRA
jgi:type II secretory ATPase GspE/PulE/Tfp pilus assembly ATPase PilB-like protein